MTGTIKNITALVALASLALSGSLEAAELDTTLRALPMHAVTFDIGSKHAISYFLVNDGNCDLTVWLTDISHDDEAAQARQRAWCLRLRLARPCGSAPLREWRQSSPVPRMPSQ